MKGLRHEGGVTLIETMIAVFIAVIGVFSLGSLVFQASATSKNQGTEATRAVIYAQDKVEKVLSLAAVPTVAGQPDFATCTATPTSTQPAQCNTTAISGSGWTTGLVAGGSVSPMQATCPSGAPYLGYMDFLNGSGVQVDACANPNPNPLTNPELVVAYIRQWQIADLAAATTPAAFAGGPAGKQITVAVYSVAAVNTNGGKPVVIVTTSVTNPNSFCRAMGDCGH